MSLVLGPWSLVPPPPGALDAEFYAASAMSCLMVAVRAAKRAAVSCRPFGLSL